MVFTTTGDTLPITSGFLVAPEDRVQGQATIQDGGKER
jgi:hypothetical protein